MNVLESTSDRFAFSTFLQRRFNVNVLTSDGRRILTLKQRRLMTLYKRVAIDVRSICIFNIFTTSFQRKLFGVMWTSYFDVETTSFNDVVTTSFNDVVTTSCNRRQIDLHFQHFYNVVSTSIF